jgi:hypothetical protein
MCDDNDDVGVVGVDDDDDDDDDVEKDGEAENAANERLTFNPLVSSLPFPLLLPIPLPPPNSDPSLWIAPTLSIGANSVNLEYI